MKMFLIACYMLLLGALYVTILVAVIGFALTVLGAALPIIVILVVVVAIISALS